MFKKFFIAIAIFMLFVGRLQAELVAEYRFDECVYAGIPGEVKDNFGDYNGTSAGDASVGTDAILGRALNLNSGSVIIDNLDINTETNTSNTVMFWMYWDGKSNVMPFGWLRYDLWIGSNNMGFNTGSSDRYGIDISSLKNGWHHITAIFTNGDVHSNKLYIDGMEQNLSQLQGTPNNTYSYAQARAKIGGWLINNNYNFYGYLDELKIFKGELNATSIQTFYNNELNGKNFDDTDRETTTCDDTPIGKPKAEYRFDECIWNGTNGELKDSSKNHYDGTASATSPTNDGVLNNAANFMQDTNTDYISLNKNAADGLNNFTILTWFKTPKKGSQILLSGANKSQDNELIFWIGNNTSVSPVIKNSNKSVSVPDLSDNQWHMIAWTRKKDQNCIYLDGTKQGCVSIPEGALEIDPGGLILGQEQDAVGGGFDKNQNFVGLQDELKIFDYAFSEEKIKRILMLDKRHTNLDQSHRIVIDCTSPQLLAEYRFDECKYTAAAGEVKDTAGGHDGTITGDANLSKDEKKIGHALKLNGGAVDIDGLPVATDQYRKNTVMFWMYWDGKSNVMPFGWLRYDLWIGSNNMGFNTGSGDRYGIDISSLKNGWHHITAIFTNGDVHSNKLYIDGVEQQLSQIDGTPNNNYSYVQSSARIGGWKHSRYYRFTSHLDELKIYKGELNATTITDIYNTESNLVRTISCAQAIFNAVDRANGCFHWDNNITTKVAGADIDLTILATYENDGNSSLTDANITKIELLSFSDPACSTLYGTTELWSGNEAVDSNGCFTPSTFTHDKAIKCAKIRITGIYEGNSVEANSSDTFSIRPDRFVLENLPTGKLTAEKNYTLKVKALNSDGTTTTSDYNQTLTPTSKKYFRDDTDGSAMDGTFTPTDAFTFSDGTTADTTLSFDNVGKIGLELNDTTWAQVDSDDTPLAQRTIYLEQNLTFIPDRFAITFDAVPTMDNHGRSFTYYTNDLANMSADLRNLSFKVTALGKNDATMTNYHDDAKYYANPINLATSLTVDQNPNITAVNMTQSGFDHGVNSITYSDRHFNFGRERNVTKEPLFVDGSNSDLNITVIDSVDHEVNGTTSQHFDGNATFYYGRIRTKDLRTSDTPAQNSISMLIYSSTPLSGFKQFTQNWYINKEDNVSDWISATPKSSRALSSATPGGISITDVDATATAGIKRFDITNTDTARSQKAFYHLDIPAWLWYSRYEDYSFAGDTTCAAHPCFTYIFDAASEDQGISSGHFKGAAFDHNFTSAPKRKAVKLLR